MRTRERLLIVAVLAASGAPGTAAETRQVVASAEYGAGGWHRFWFGSGYRDVWTAPVTLPVLDLSTEAGGLTPVRQVGGMQTPGLAMKGGDGQSYTFRNLIKEPERLLPEEWRDTLPAKIIRDQMSAGHPAVAPVVSHLARSVGILYQHSRVAIMPDDPRLGEFRKTFGNQVGTFDTYPLPGVDGITEIVSTKDLWQKWLAGDAYRVDSRAFLKARLLDLVVGNWDRHRKQWRWAHVEGKTLWQPVPEDPDQAFSRYGGAVLSLVRVLQPQMMDYSGKYPGSVDGLTFNNDDVNRWLLSDLEWPAYEETARLLQGELTDAVIDEAVKQMPPEWYAVSGAGMAAALKQRRDGLAAFVRKFYRHLSDRVDVRGSDRPETAAVRRLEGGSLEVTLTAESEPEPYYTRRFLPSDTDEVRIYLQGGNDRIVESGGQGGITVRVLGGEGDDALDDSTAGGSDLRDSEGRNTFVRGSGTIVHEKPWKNPAPLDDGAWIEPRNYGSRSGPLAMLWWEPDQDIMIGGGITRTSWSFRKYPWATFQTLTAVYSTGYQKFRINYSGQRRLTAQRLLSRVDVLASGAEDLNYFGFGNETVDVDQNLYQTQEYTFSAFPSLRYQPSRDLEVYGGVEARALKPVGDQQTLVVQDQPYGSGQFGEIVARAGFEWDSRGRLGSLLGAMPTDLTQAKPRPVSGVRLVGDTFVSPKAWDVTSTWGGVDGSLSGYVGNNQVAFAARVGGRKLWGTYPWAESAVIGGSHNVRGYTTNRYRGDSSLYFNSEVRLWLGRRKTPLLPLRWGLIGFAETGRVWYQGEESDTWHPGYGGGALVQLLGLPLTLCGSIAQGDEGTHFYFKAGYSF